jgi:hypothetical protein
VVCDDSIRVGSELSGCTDHTRAWRDFIEFFEVGEKRERASLNFLIGSRSVISQLLHNAFYTLVPPSTAYVIALSLNGIGGALVQGNQGLAKSGPASRSKSKSSTSWPGGRSKSST